MTIVYIYFLTSLFKHPPWLLSSLIIYTVTSYCYYYHEIRTNCWLTAYFRVISVVAELQNIFVENRNFTTHQCNKQCTSTEKKVIKCCLVKVVQWVQAGDRPPSSWFRWYRLVHLTSEVHDHTYTHLSG